MEPSITETDEFRIWCMKVLRCPRRCVHDWTVCPFAHVGERAARRDPQRFNYTGIACPEMKREGTCPRGDACPYAHTVFEYWLHETRYRTQACNDGPRCTRVVCFFAHSPSELRSPVVKPHLPADSLGRGTRQVSDAADAAFGPGGLPGGPRATQASSRGSGATDAARGAWGASRASQATVPGVLAATVASRVAAPDPAATVAATVAAAASRNAVLAAMQGAIEATLPRRPRGRSPQGLSPRAEDAGAPLTPTSLELGSDVVLAATGAFAAPSMPAERAAPPRHAASSPSRGAQRRGAPPLGRSASGLRRAPLALALGDSAPQPLSLPIAPTTVPETVRSSRAASRSTTLGGSSRRGGGAEFSFGPAYPPAQAPQAPYGPPDVGGFKPHRLSPVEAAGASSDEAAAPRRRLGRTGLRRSRGRKSRGGEGEAWEAFPAEAEVSSGWDAHRDARRSPPGVTCAAGAGASGRERRLIEVSTPPRAKAVGDRPAGGAELAADPAAVARSAPKPRRTSAAPEDNFSGLLATLAMLRLELAQRDGGAAAAGGAAGSQPDVADLAGALHDMLLRSRSGLFACGDGAPPPPRRGRRTPATTWSGTGPEDEFSRSSSAPYDGPAGAGPGTMLASLGALESNRERAPIPMFPPSLPAAPAGRGRSVADAERNSPPSLFAHAPPEVGGGGAGSPRGSTAAPRARGIASLFPETAPLLSVEASEASLGSSLFGAGASDASQSSPLLGTGASDVSRSSSFFGAGASDASQSSPLFGAAQGSSFFGVGSGGLASSHPGSDDLFPSVRPPLFAPRSLWAVASGSDPTPWDVGLT